MPPSRPSRLRGKKHIMLAARKKVLHITIHLPFPTNHGASLFNSYKLATYLHKNHDLFFACFLKGDDVKYKDAFLADTGIKQSYFEVLNVERKRRGERI